MTDQLKPCPLCSGPAYLSDTVNGTSMRYVGCVACGISLKAAWVPTGHPAVCDWSRDIVAVWNTRPTEGGEDGKPRPIESAPRCSDCPPVDYPTDVTRCLPCPRRSAAGPETTPGGGEQDQGSSSATEQVARASTLPLGPAQHSAGWEPENSKLGEAVTLWVVIAQPARAATSIWIGGHEVQVPNDALKTSWAFANLPIPKVAP